MSMDWHHFLSLGLSVVWAVTSSPVSAKGYKWSCSYSQSASVDGLKPDSFNMEFAFDDVTQKGVNIGNNGVADVEFQSGRSGVSFLEKLQTGAVQSTTIANDGTSVHSRHTIIGTKMMASQYYGHCRQ